MQDLHAFIQVLQHGLSSLIFRFFDERGVQHGMQQVQHHQQLQHSHLQMQNPVHQQHMQKNLQQARSADGPLFMLISAVSVLPIVCTLSVLPMFVGLPAVPGFGAPAGGMQVDPVVCKVSVIPVILELIVEFAGVCWSCICWVWLN